jgi:hypothetical protein
VIKLLKSDIIGHRLVRIVDTYECLSSHGFSFNYFENYFVLESGVVFQFHHHANADFIKAPLPDVRPIEPEEPSKFRDSIRMRLESGHWIWHISSALFETGTGGLCIDEEPPDEPDTLIDFWHGRLAN